MDLTPDGLNVISLNDGADYLIWRKGSGPTVEIYDIAVCSERRKGVGTRLVKELLSRMPPTIKTVWAITRAENYPARYFYRSLGFRLSGKLQRFYNDGGFGEEQTTPIDALLYAITLH